MPQRRNGGRPHKKHGREEESRPRLLPEGKNFQESEARVALFV